MRAQEFLVESQYREIEFVCANPQFPEATDPALQKKMYQGLKRIPGVVPVWQEWSDYSEGQASLSAIYQDPRTRSKILALAKQLGVKIDLEQSVSDEYVDRAVRGEHEGQLVDENFADGKKPGRKGLSRRVGIPKKATLAQLEKIARSSTGERRRMAQWQLNMRRGRAQKNK